MRRADETGRRRKYERMGWSPAKIERALASSEGAPPPKRQSLTKDVVDIVTSSAAAAGEVRLIVHEFSGLFAEERVVPRETTAFDVDGFRNAVIELDTLYIIKGMNR